MKTTLSNPTFDALAANIPIAIVLPVSKLVARSKLPTTSKNERIHGIPATTQLLQFILAAKLGGKLADRATLTLKIHAVGKKLIGHTMVLKQAEYAREVLIALPELLDLLGIQYD